MSSIALSHPLVSDGDELRQERLLAGMAAIEWLYDSLPPGLTVPPEHALAVASLINDATRDLLLWAPGVSANDNG